MRRLLSTTLAVEDPEASARLYVETFDYRRLESGTVTAELAESWGAPAAAGRPYVVCGPPSGAEQTIRFVGQPRRPDFRPLRTYGWAAAEICVRDVLQVNERVLKSPFKIVGPPARLDGLPTIFPMQVEGPDQEIVYLTEIQGDLPDYDLPRASSLVDLLFIMVLACSNLAASRAFFEEELGLAGGREMALVYTMINQAFGLPLDEKQVIATMTDERDVFLELDQYPPGATPRAGHPGDLPPGIALATFSHPRFEGLVPRLLAPPRRLSGPIYKGRRSGVLKGPDGVLVELVEA